MANHPPNLDDHTGGFSVVELLIVLVCIGIIGMVGWTVLQRHRTVQSRTTSTSSAANSGAPNTNQSWSDGKCSGTGSAHFSASPLAVSNIDSIAPMGNMVGAHVTPSDHLGFSPQGSSAVNVYAPADGYIVQLEYNANEKWYGALIEHSCTFYSRVFLMSDLASKLKKSLHGPNTSVRIQVSAGEIIGTIAGHGIDFWVADLKTSQQFANPSRYYNEPWKLYDVDPFDYYGEPLKSELIALDLRQAKPFGGQIDYDLTGTMAGNWFIVGAKFDQNPEKNALNQLSFARDWLDPTVKIASIGNYDGKPEQISISDTSPDPKNVTAKDGLVKFALVPFEYKLPSGQTWDRMHAAVGLKGSINDTAIQATVLAQLQADGKLRLETFIGKTPSQVSNFDSQARNYER